jgi:hypothetical protein
MLYKGLTFDEHYCAQVCTSVRSSSDARRSVTLVRRYRLVWPFILDRLDPLWQGLDARIPHARTNGWHRVCNLMKW